VPGNGCYLVGTGAPARASKTPRTPATPFPTSPRAAMIAAAVGVGRFFFL